MRKYKQSFWEIRDEQENGDTGKAPNGNLKGEGLGNQEELNTLNFKKS